MNDHSIGQSPAPIGRASMSSHAALDLPTPTCKIAGLTPTYRRTGMPAVGPAEARGRRQILCITESTAGIRSMRRLFACRTDIDLVAVQRLGVGLAIAAYQGLDVIVLDVNFRKRGADGGIRRVRSDAQFASTPVVAISTHPLPGDIRRAHELGFDACLMKPTDGGRLLRVLDLLLLRPAAFSTYPPQRQTWAADSDD